MGLVQKHPALKLPLVQRVLGAALHFSELLHPQPDAAVLRRRAKWVRRGARNHVIRARG